MSVKSNKQSVETVVAAFLAQTGVSASDVLRVIWGKLSLPEKIKHVYRVHVDDPGKIVFSADADITRITLQELNDANGKRYWTSSSITYPALLVKNGKETLRETLVTNPQKGAAEKGLYTLDTAFDHLSKRIGRDIVRDNIHALRGFDPLEKAGNESKRIAAQEAEKRANSAEAKLAEMQAKLDALLANPAVLAALQSAEADSK